MAFETARLYLLTPLLVSITDIPATLHDAAAAGDVACLLIRLTAESTNEAKKIVQKIVEVAQPLNIAVLVEGDASLVVRANADGIHIHKGLQPNLKETLKSLQPARTVGIGGLKGRDDAMAAGEAGVDYVLFGEPSADGYVPPVAQTIDRTAWWSEIFNVPCVAYVHRLADVAAVSAAGPEFIALGSAVWDDPRGPAAAVREAQMLLHPLPQR